MRKITLGAVVLAAGLAAGCASSSSSPVTLPTGGLPSASASASPAPTNHRHRHHHHRAQAAAGGTSCNAGLWAHVYHPDRLQIVRRCMTVRGTVTQVRWEPDGDLHIRLATRPALVNSVNVSEQAGDLVLEEICQSTVSQADAEDACQGVPHNLTVPAAGDRVRVTGSYVLDADHGWMEIHPVTRLTVTGHGAAPAPSQPAAGGCHPVTPSGNCYEPGEFCAEAQHGETGVAGDGKTITCQLDGSYWRWE